ncbi:MAG: hypothetical protein ACREPF_07845 [Rhodanobacteraceae bacterium]
MRAQFIFPTLPRNPLLRTLVVAGMVVVVLGLLALGLVIGVGILAVATVALTVRHWRLRHRQRAAQDAIIDGDFTVVEPRPPARLPPSE